MICLEIHWIDPRAIRAVSKWLRDNGAITLGDRYTIRERTGCTIDDIDAAIDFIRKEEA